jgi:methylamine dehydrogenase accessory protein MauD
MNTFVLISAFETIVILFAAFATWRLTRHVRRLFQEVAPVGALTGERGPQPGDQCPVGPFMTLEGTPYMLGYEGEKSGSALLLFVSATCPLSRKMLAIARDFCQREHLRLVFAGDDRAVVLQTFIKQAGMADYPFINDATLGRALEVDKLPMAFLLSAEGVILSRGLVNNREHLESLLNAWESGFATVQNYIVHRRRNAHDTAGAARL